VTDLEDGTNPINTYGRSQEEVLAKIERTGMHAQLHIPRVANQPQNNGNGRAPVPPAPAQNPHILSPDEKMRTTLDLQNPAKAAEAVVKLQRDQQATEEEEQKAFARRVAEWKAANPSWPAHPVNDRLLLLQARTFAPAWKAITSVHLDQAFRELEASGVLLGEEPPTTINPAPPPVQPEENPATRTNVRPRSAYATSHRSTRLQAAQTAQWRPKYTKEQIVKMPLAKSAELLRSNDRDYAEANEYWFGSEARATA
jgi:hypothetical protein